MRDDALQLLLGDSRRLLLGLTVMTARLAPLLTLTPVFGGALVPRTVRTALLVAMGLVIYPAVATTLDRVVGGSGLLLAAVLLSEVWVGVVLALLVSLVFWAAQSAGWLVDTARGSAHAEVLMPGASGRSTASGTLVWLLSIVLFFAIGGHRALLMAAARSYVILPPGAFPAPEGLRAIAWLCLRLTGELIALALVLAAPVLAALWLTDLALGWVNRLVPQVGIFFVAMPLKALAGVGMLALVVGPLLMVLPASLELAMGYVGQAIALLAPAPTG
ncbi:MAG: flagellar biosynthetic protein FliR [Proteobacteria bacterium]|nr:flagellar biosynthetic protein FliR [Pseudomonadota bacterium]